MSELREHKKYSPSKAEQFLLCPGSVALLERTPPREPSPDAEEGQTAHTVLEAGLTNGCINATQAIDNSIHCAEDFDMEFKASINDALDYIWKIMEELRQQYDDVVMFVEVFVDPPVHAAPGEAGGFVDVAIYTAKGRKLYIIDYKHGVGVPKAVIDNKQTKQYAAGFLFEDKPKIDPATVDEVIMVIIQPRSFHPDGEIREYVTNPAELFDYLMELDEGIEACQKPDAPLIPGEEQCRFCPARSTCPALEAAALQAVDPQARQLSDLRAGRLPDPKNLDLQRLSYILNMKKLILTFLNDTENHVDSLLRAGINVPGYKLVEVKAKRTYYGNEEDIAVKLAAQIGCSIDEVYKRKLINITDAEAMIVNAFKSRVSRNKRKQAAEDAKQTFAWFTLKKSSGAITVVPEDDPRPAVNKAIQAFGSINGLLPPPQ